jgi:transcriptional regulator with XRE-family HTH domain
MTEGLSGSTVPRRQLGRHLRDLRGQARLTLRAAATALEWSEAKMWRIETGQTSMRSLDVEQMCRIYGAPAGQTTSLMALAKETKARGWWLSYSDVINEGFDVFIGLEEAASRILQYESELLPGLLQTEDYARALFTGGISTYDPQEVERRVQLRLARQTLLTRVTNPPDLHVVLNEAVLHRPVGGRKVMADQLEKLVKMAELPNVSIRVVPFTTGFHQGLNSGPFILMEFPVNSNGQPTEPPTIYVDSFTGALYLDKPSEIDQYSRAFEGLWTIATSEPESRNAIAEAAKQLGS